MTDFGYIYVCISFILFFSPIKYYVPFLIFSCVFETTSVINIGEKGLLPFVLGSLFFIVKTFGSFFRRGHNLNLLKNIFFFCLYVSIITLVSPILFSGIRIIESNLDTSILQHDTLKIGAPHYSQLLINIVRFFTLYLIYINRKLLDNDLLKKSFLFSVAFVVFLGFWEFLDKSVGIHPQFPADFFMNNPGLGLETGSLYTTGTEDGGGMRMSSIYCEASNFGGFVGPAFWAVFFMIDMKFFMKPIYLVFIVMAILSSLSGTAFVSFLCGFLYLSFKNGFNIKYLLIAILLFAILISVLVFSDSFDNALLQLQTKSTSQSGSVRLQTSLIALSVFIESFCLGVGLGYNHCSSFICESLSTIGIIGTFLFFVIYHKIVFRLREYRDAEYIFAFMIMLLIAEMIALPVLGYEILWLGLYMSAAFNEKSLKLANKL